MHIELNLPPQYDEQDVPGWRLAVASGILGWVLDAFDFFVVIFLLDVLAAHFNVEKKAIIWTISITLAMRPVGALLFGALADQAINVIAIVQGSSECSISLIVAEADALATVAALHDLAVVPI